MNPIDSTILVASLSMVGGFIVALVNHTNSKQNKAFDNIVLRLSRTEDRVDRLEKDLEAERHERIMISVYAEALHNWAIRAYQFITMKGLEFDKPPIKKPLVRRPEDSGVPTVSLQDWMGDIPTAGSERGDNRS